MNKAAQKTLSLVLLAVGVVLTVISLILDFTGNKGELRGSYPYGRSLVTDFGSFEVPI